jgi:DNA-binding MarR family transcriptional regulator
MTEPRRRVAFLLSQLGSLSAARFADLTRAAGLSPQDAGVLRLIAGEPGMSQRALADRVGAVPSRVVVLVDSLESRGLVVRTRSENDRRNHALHLTDEGRAALAALRPIGLEHEREVLAPLTEDERARLGELLTKLASGHGLDPEVHPGYASSRGGVARDR